MLIRQLIFSFALHLAFFRIDADDVIIISDATQKPSEESLEEFNRIIGRKQPSEDHEEGRNEASEEQDDGDGVGSISEDDFIKHKEKTNFYLRISEVR